MIYIAVVTVHRRLVSEWWGHLEVVDNRSTSDCCYCLRRYNQVIVCISTHQTWVLIQSDSSGSSWTSPTDLFLRMRSIVGVGLKFIPVDAMEQVALRISMKMLFTIVAGHALFSVWSCSASSGVCVRSTFALKHA